ncbi:hypothetical protein V6N11_019756 [Hibiscus sabdariffa]|uniref:DNA-directed RNA polymerase n=1 Tax=Hibiscus sabdariffa TaxID=183260 RepID=A0ABR2A535_9ROSI
MVRVPSLVEGLEKAVRQQAKLYTSRRLIKSVSKGADDVEDGFECENIESYQDGNQEKKEGMEVMYLIGRSLVSFNHERNFILLYNDFDPIKVIPKEKDKKYYLPRNLYDVCKFNVALLPIKLDLTMICPPLEWKSVRRSGGCYIPITQDASGSAYQIMSYFFLDEILGMKTNLLPSKDGNINDIYSFILEELKEFLKKELLEESQDPRLSDIVCKEFDRKIVKSIFMPKIYGKTLMSTAKDLKNVLSHYLTNKECFKVARLCFKFWSLNYHKLENLSKLIGNIGWVAATRERPVYYKILIQREIVGRQQSLPSFVNFIHQRDAHIAMNVIEEMHKINGPIYTVHDNFITTPDFADRILGVKTVALILNRLNLKISHTTILDPHPGLVIASLHFQEPYPLVNEIDLLSLATMDLLIQFAYPSLSGYGKFSISFTMIRSYGEEISFTLGPAIPLTYEDGKFVPMAEGSYATHITALKLSRTKVKPFIVADIETLRCGDDEFHKPYAVSHADPSQDSLNLLPGKLSELAKNLCPDLGTKGSIPYDELKASENSILDWIVSIYEINRKHWYHPLVGMTLSHWLASFDLRFTGSRAGQLLTSLRNRANKTPRTWSLK